MKLSDLKELLELIAARDITEFELEEEGVKLRVKKGGAAPVSVAHVQPLAPMAAPPPTIVAPPTSTSPEPLATESADEGLFIVKAPMVGTFYRQPGPGSQPFAKKGDAIERGQVLCIIEAMKLMNEIESESSGELVEVFVEDGRPVQFGDRLFSIRES